MIYELVVPLADIPDGGAKIVEVRKNLRVALFRVGERVAAVNNRCPHSSASLGDGDFDGATVVCPLHEWRFNVWNGAGAKPLTVYAARVAGGEVRVMVPDPPPAAPKPPADFR